MPIDGSVLSRSKRPCRDEDTLKYLACKNGSLFYELWMLLEAERLWVELEPKKHEASTRYNIAIEDFLFHFRNLRDFLYPSKHAWTKEIYFDDVIAHDFDPGWHGVEDDWEECSPDERERINKMLAHLSYSRPNLHRKVPGGWPISAMSKAAQKELAKFIRGLPPERKEWFKDIRID